MIYQCYAGNDVTFLIRGKYVPIFPIFVYKYKFKVGKSISMIIIVWLLFFANAEISDKYRSEGFRLTYLNTFFATEVQRLYIH